MLILDGTCLDQINQFHLIGVQASLEDMMDKMSLVVCAVTHENKWPHVG